jgi:squalene-hopene/tetraprenyl-beta-curcumene cyclase
MTSRTLYFASFAQGMVALAYSIPASGGENSPERWDRSSAAQYLDRRGESWFNFGGAHRGQGESRSSCISCHSLLPYALARPVLRRISDESVPTKLETRILEQIRRRVANWDRLDSPPLQLYYDFDDDKKKQSRGTEEVLNALVLSLDDRHEARPQPSDDTKKALSILWATQITAGEHKGSWDWLNFGLDPWESTGGRYMGAALAAIAVGSAPGNSVADAVSRERLDDLRGYLKKHFDAQNLHDRVWMLWASTCIDGLLTPEQKAELISQLVAKQHSSGGWSLVSLGKFTRKDVTEAKEADGYATGLVLHVLQLAGASKDEPAVSKGLAWLRSNQDPAGGWRAASLNKNRAPESKDSAKANVGKFMWDAATGYAVLALSHAGS